MPRRRRSVKVRRYDFREENYDHLYFELVYGEPAIGGDQLCQDLDALAEAWEIFGERVLAEFIERSPGMRPLAWWIVHHGKERPLIRQPPRDELRSIRQQHTHYAFFHSNILGMWPTITNGRARGWGPLQLEEFKYLDRKKLLQDGELERAVQTIVN